MALNTHWRFSCFCDCFFLAWMVFEVCKWSLRVRGLNVGKVMPMGLFSCESYQKRGLNEVLIRKKWVVHKHL